MSFVATLMSEENKSPEKIKSQSKDPIADRIYDLLKLLGESPEREGLLRTPHRVSKSLKELTKGYQMDPYKEIGHGIFQSESDGQVMVKDINLFSTCEHHLLPFFGKVHVAYMPNGKIIGLSKIPRIVEVFSKRLQIQERLTREIADLLDDVLKPKGIAVFTQAQHLCMSMRGVEQKNATTQCLELRGCFKGTENQNVQPFTNPFLVGVKGSA